MRIQNILKKQNVSFKNKLHEDFVRNKFKYLMMIPVIAFFVIFKYLPMYGVIIAFKNFRPSLGITGSQWVGVKNFEMFFKDVFFWRTLRNTFLLSFFNIAWGFPMPIILALLLNELRNNKFKRIVQTATYIPHFLSLVIVCGLIVQYCSTNGLFNDIRVILGMDRLPILQQADNFRTIYVTSGIWQNMGWSSIIYIAALSGVDTQLYDAAEIDGAGRFKKMIHVSLSGIMPTIMILLILRTGEILNIGYEKVLLLYSPVTYETADVISTYVYRKGLINGDFSYSTAIGLFNSSINLIFILSANYLSSRRTGVNLF